MSQMQQMNPPVTEPPSMSSTSSSTSPRLAMGLESIPEYAGESESEEQQDQNQGQGQRGTKRQDELAQAVEAIGLDESPNLSQTRTASSSLINTPTTSASNPSTSGTARARVRSIDVPAISLPSTADVLTSLPDPRPLHVAAMRSTPGSQAHDLLATMESVLDPGTPRNVFNDLLRADRASLPDSLWVPKIAHMFADAPWLVEAFLMVVGWVGPDPLMMSHAVPSAPGSPSPIPQHGLTPALTLPTPVFHARVPSPNYDALMGPGLGRSVSPPGTAKGWFIDHPRSPMHALAHPEQQPRQQPVFSVSPAAAGGLDDDGFANFVIPTILHSPVASPRESPAPLSPEVSVVPPSPLGLSAQQLGEDEAAAEVDPDSVPLAPSLLQVKPVSSEASASSTQRSPSPLAQCAPLWIEAEAGDITDEDHPLLPRETLGGSNAIEEVQGPGVDDVTIEEAEQVQPTQPGRQGDDQDDDPLGWVDDTMSSSSSDPHTTSSQAPTTNPTGTAFSSSTTLTPSKLIETYTQLDKSRAHLLHLPPCGKLPSGNSAVLPLPQRMQQQQAHQMHQMHHPSHHHPSHHHHSHCAHAHGHHGAAHHGAAHHREHHGGFLHPSIAFGIHHGARHAAAAHAHRGGESAASPHAFHGHPDYAQLPGPHSEDAPRSSPHEHAQQHKEGEKEEGQEDLEHIRAARDRGHDSYAVQKALSERRLGMDI